MHDSYATDPAALGFHFSEDVSELTSHGDGKSWMLQVAHRKTAIVCELAGGEGTTNEEARITCSDGLSAPPAPGGDDDDDDEEEPGSPTPPANAAPVAHFTWTPPVPNPGETVNFDASGSSDDVGVVSYDWLFEPDSHSAGGATTSRVFAAPGEYLVRLIVQDAVGAADTLQQNVRVNAPPVAQFTFTPENPGVGDTVTFDALDSLDPDGDTLTFTWDFGDDETDEGSVLKKVFDTPGEYVVRLTVSDSLGLMHTDSQTVEVSGPSIGLSKIAVGVNHACALSVDGDAYCWGNNSYGQLGSGSAGGTQKKAVKVAAGSLKFVEITTGVEHTCAITTSHDAYCWGRGSSGRTGLGHGFNVSTPEPVAASGMKFTQIAAGEQHTCALGEDSKAYCWGSASLGRLGNGAGSGSSATPVQVLSAAESFASISAGVDHTCALRANGSLYCWGSNEVGQVGQAPGGPGEHYTTPRMVSIGMPFAAATAAANHTCAITSGNAWFCWGPNNGNLGPLATEPFYAEPLSLTYGYAQVFVHNSSGCGLDASGNAFCYGNGGQGQLGSGQYFNAGPNPVAVIGGLKFSTLSSGHSTFVCGITLSGDGYCWGSNSHGQLGADLSDTRANQPMQIVFETP